jgi:hypothetical protein
MTVALTKTFPRLWSLEQGLAMVVTDLHGDWGAYQRYRDRFVNLQATGQVDYLICTGDLIHGEDPTKPDKSLEIVLDVMSLQATYGQAIIYLCGNHEIPHIYGISLAKGQKNYTPPFEAVLSQSQDRSEIIDLFDSLPFYLRTRAGVSLTHAGASAPITVAGKALELFNWSHQHLLNWADQFLAAEDVEALRNSYARLNHVSYDALARYFLAVSGPDDARYDDWLRGFLASSQPSFDQLLWPALFTRCEHDYGQADYAIFLDALLQELSVDFYPQQLLVAGHITIRGGYQVVANRHLRLASAHHATPQSAGRYLLFDTGQPIQEVKDLLKGLGTVYK